jgi:hypothetical protein
VTAETGTPAETSSAAEPRVERRDRARDLAHLLRFRTTVGGDRRQPPLVGHPCMTTRCSHGRSSGPVETPDRFALQRLGLQVAFWRFLTLLLAALGLTPGAAHALELPPRRAYDAELYATVTSMLYQLFGSVGAVVQVGSVLTSAILTIMVRRGPAFRLTLLGTLGLVLSLVLWAILVAPVNAEWLRGMQTAPEAVPEAYARLRTQWEYGHLAAFAAWLAGFGLLLVSVLRTSTPTPRPSRGGVTWSYVDHHGRRTIRGRSDRTASRATSPLWERRRRTRPRPPAPGADPLLLETPAQFLPADRPRRLVTALHPARAMTCREERPAPGHAAQDGRGTGPLARSANST